MSIRYILQYQTLALALQIKQRFWYRYRIDKYEVNSRKNVQLYLKITDNFPRGLKLNLKFYAKVIIVDDESSGRKLIKEYLEYYPIILLWRSQ
jgi:hypothetical protein